VNDLKDEFGEVVGQLLEYTYARVPSERRTKGQNLAMDSAYAWAHSLIVPEFQAKTEVTELTHQGDSASCDAVRLVYQLEGQLQLDISQTVFAIEILLRPWPWPVEWRGNDPKLVNRFARQFFRDSGRLNLRLDKQRDAVSLGSQAPSPTVRRAERDWLDSLRWWCDGKMLGFVILKRTGAGQAVLPTLDLRSNLVWFQMLERSRTG